MSKELKPCPFCGHRIDIEKDVYNAEKDWKPSFYDPDSGGDPISIHCECGLEFCTGTYDWGEFVDDWNNRSSTSCTDDEDDKIDEIYDMLGNELTWLMSYGEDVYLQVGADIKGAIMAVMEEYDET